MIRINQLKLPLKHSEEDIKNACCKALKIQPKELKNLHIVKKSIDARKKDDMKYIYAIDITLEEKAEGAEEKIIKRAKNANVMAVKPASYQWKVEGEHKLNHRPVVVGTGPAGIFCGYLLAMAGYQPLLIERGQEIEKRVQNVEHFWKSNELNPESNVQFGEGGAGTFSDGKLNTLIKDSFRRYQFVVETFVKHGAPSDILYLNKPHIGTDQLRHVVVHMRKEIIRMGGEFRFETALTDLVIENDELKGIVVNHKETIPCEVLIPAIGHSSRDTFHMFYGKGLVMTPKAFAMGLRIEHKQSMIGEGQYGSYYKDLPAADYKLTHQTSLGRGVYSFCMCPGGFVVNASSEDGHLVVNGMSNYHRDEVNANSAIVVTVTPEDYGGEHPLKGIEFQREWERKAYLLGKGNIPVQLLGDFLRNESSTTLGNIKPNTKGSWNFSNLTESLPTPVIQSIQEGLMNFDTKIKGFGHEEAILLGVESRTSSPVRIQRDQGLESNIKGIYPCGEGAGYAGGITSAAIDGMKVFEEIAKKFAP